MRTDLYRDPKVCMIADFLIGGVCKSIGCYESVTSNVMRNVTRNATVGALVSIWGILRLRGKRVGDDLVVAGVNEDIVDDIGDLQGIGAAMSAVGWMIVADDGAIFPNFFEEFNTEPSSRAMSNAERQRAFRERKKQENYEITDNSGCVTKSNARNGREEKRREEKREEKNNAREEPQKPIPTIPETLSTPQFLTSWEAWQRHRKEKRQTLTPTAIGRQLSKLAEMGPQRAIAAIEHSISMGYTGIFEPGTPKNGPSPAFGGPKEGYGPPETTKAIIERLYAEKQKRENGGQ